MLIAKLVHAHIELTSDANGLYVHRQQKIDFGFNAHRVDEILYLPVSSESGTHAA